MDHKLPDFGDTNVVFLTKYGSHLYGTATEDSDMDLKGVFLPTAEQILLGKVPKTLSFSTKGSGKNEKNTKDDVDCELYSFGYFLDLATQGQTVALEMLWACNPVGLGEHFMSNQSSHVLKYTHIWNEVVGMRNMFLTKNMKAFMGYAKGQAVRYSLKGDKLNTARSVLKAFRSCMPNHKLNSYWDIYKDMFAEDPNVKFVIDQNGVKMMEVCRRALQETVTVKYAMGIMQGVVDQYGTRTKAAADHDGADFKALAHAYRVSLELRDLYQNRALTFPFNSDRIGLLLHLKSGGEPVSEIMSKLDYVLAQVEKLAAESGLPDKVNSEFTDFMLIQVYGEVVKNGLA